MGITRDGYFISFLLSIVTDPLDFRGKKDVESISFYNKKGKAFLDDGQYYESAFGDRIFGTYNLWKNTKDLLLSDPNTRRALIPIFFPEDIAKLPLDTSCASYIHLMIRENKLDMILSMRSQSAILVFPYDIFLFTMLQEFFSLNLSVELGKLTYFCDSFHYYIEEEELGKEIISNYSKKSLTQEMPKMMRLSEQQLSGISSIESGIRKNIIRNLSYPDNDVYGLPEYWKGVMKVLWSKAYKETKGINDKNVHVPSYLDGYSL